MSGEIPDFRPPNLERKLYMQEAIRNYIEIQSKNMVPLEKIDNEIDKVRRSEIKIARQKQLRQWRNLERR